VHRREVAVRCDSWNPGWSWYAGDASATAQIELTGGARFSYAGSRCTPGLQTSFNAEWRAYGERGAASWDGEQTVVADPGGTDQRVAAGPEGIAGSLAEFVGALRSGRTPQNEVRANVLSIAMVEGAVRSSALGGERVVIADLLEEALESALVTERQEDVLAVLRSWPDAAHGIATPAWGSAPAPIAAGGAR
jgi:myo-inositol 2-dehydrogenase/D-chiro-inositol 1-dehydrogenase